MRIPSERSLWAKKRNWLIRRLKGAKSVFGADNIELLYQALEQSEWKRITRVMSDLNFLTKKLSETKWKE